MKQSSSIKYSFLLLVVTVFFGKRFCNGAFCTKPRVNPRPDYSPSNGIRQPDHAPHFFKSIRRSTKKEIKHGVIAGFMLFLGFMLQTAGMQYTTISNSAFLTTTNVIMVPFLSWFIIKKRPDVKTFFPLRSDLSALVY